AMSASRVSWATFWARARISLASRRASVSAVMRSCSAFSRSRRACSASLSPCSILDLRSVSMAVTGLSANAQISAKKRMKLSALTITQNRLIWNSAASPSAASCATWWPAPVAMARTSISLLDEDREEADDDRKNAEAFCEGSEDDRDAADLSGRVRVAADGRSRQTAEDADADAGTDDPEGGEAGADVLHVVSSSYFSGDSPEICWDLWVGSAERRVSGRAGAWAPTHEVRQGPLRPPRPPRARGFRWRG